jgi:hypothetical protein
MMVFTSLFEKNETPFHHSTPLTGGNWNGGYITLGSAF